MLFTYLSGGIYASVFYVGQHIGFGEVKSTSSADIDGGVVYSEAAVLDDNGASQQIRTFTFDPMDGELLPLVYCKYTGYGATTLDSAIAAESLGYDVKGAINGAFFGLTGVNANIYGGVCISDGRVLQGCNDHDVTWVLAFNSDGTASLVQSKVEYTLTAGETDWTAPVVCLNVCPQDTYDIIYYYDSFCGGKTDTNYPGVEVVFDKQNHTELTVGGVLEGVVAEVRYSISEGGAIGEDQFVLYAPDGCADAASLRSLKVGDTAKINVRETVEESREVMENCNSAVVTYGYHIVSDGKNVTDYDGLGDSYNNAKGQKTGLGIKADGSMVMVTTDGRTDEHPGLTAYQLADLLISMGCVTGINLDGGYSSQMVVEDKNGEIVPKTEQTRRVPNSILIVKRSAPDTELSAALSETVYRADQLYRKFELTGDVKTLLSETEKAKTVLRRELSANGDITKAIMRLNDAMSGVVKVGYKQGIYSSINSTRIYANAEDSADTIYTVNAGVKLTVTETAGHYGFTKYLGYYGWIDLDLFDITSGTGDKTVTVNAPEVAYKGDGVTVSWSADGAAAYTYKIIEFDGAPGDEAFAETVTIAEGWTTDHTSVYIPYAERRDGYCLKIAVMAEYPAENVWGMAYVRESSLPFTDVPLDHWGYDGAVYTFENGLFNGVTASRFDPTGSMTRAMMAAVVYRMAGSPDVPEEKLSFTDVEEGSWYYKGVAWCQSVGIVTGVSETRFDPEGKVTREQTACFLYRYAKHLGMEGNVDMSFAETFTDFHNTGDYAREAIAWCVERGIMNGSYGRLNPKGEADRIQNATLICNFCTADLFDTIEN